MLVPCYNLAALDEDAWMDLLYMNDMMESGLVSIETTTMLTIADDPWWTTRFRNFG